MTDQTKPFPLYRICEALGACPDGLRRLEPFAGRSLADWIQNGDERDLVWLLRSADLGPLDNARHVDPRRLQIGLAHKALAGGRNWRSVWWHTRKPLTVAEKLDLSRRLIRFEQA